VEQAKWINELNTLLSLRLNLHDYDKIPHQFRDYQIGSGRVTFKVQGEFEVDLTIADDDSSKQFWFIDFRFGFSPSASTIPISLRTYLEACVNEALEKDGLLGCFKYLHEFVLTTKIHEAKRQALQLSRGLWTGTLQIEPLNRALAIQYWTTRTSPTGLKSWVMIAVDSRKTESLKDPKVSSSVVAKWYRDNKEVEDVETTMGVENVSVETLLRNVVGHHVEYTLTNIRDKLLTFPRFKNREAGMVLHIDKADAASSSLTMQVGYTERVSLMIEPTTGVFAIKPQSKFTVQYEHQLNNGKSPTEDGAACLENIRCSMTEDTIQRQASVAGWQTLKSPLSNEELRSLTRLRDWSRAVWLQRNGWGSTWFIVVLLGSGGDEWWLVEA
jgi:mediator of RNA polymerase II transcription subunit 14